MRRILTIFLRTGTASYPDAEPRLVERLGQQLPGMVRELIVVDNMLPPGIAEESPGRAVLGGDNSVSEFSALDAARLYLGSSIWQYDIVNVVTSAFEQLYVDYLDRFLPDVVAAIQDAPVCVGHIDCYNEPIDVLSYRSQHWLRTSFFMMPMTEFMVLGPAVSARHRAPWFSGRRDNPFSERAPLSDSYKRYIMDWLLGQDIGQGVTWHKAVSLEDEHGLELFERKALAILNEHLFGIRLRAAGCRVIDVTWLATRLSAGETPDWGTPWWDQLAERDRAARTFAPQSQAVDTPPSGALGAAGRGL